LKGKLLIVDDEPNLLRMLEFTLQVEGYSLILARNGQEAFQQVKTEQPDLVILDVSLPDMSGLEICRRLRSVAETQTLPVIMLSARGQVADKIAGLEAGADEYVTKPVDTDELVARVAALLTRTRRLRQAPPPAAGKVLGFIGAKGGTGTTTVALNVAAALARQGKTVTALELRSHFGTFSAQLGGPPLETLSDLLELEPAAITAQALSSHLIPHSAGLRLLFGPQKVEQYKNIEYAQAEAIVKGLARLGEYTLIDLPAYPAEANQAALQLCNFITLVIEPDPGSLKAGKLMLDLMKWWQVNRGIVSAVVVNLKSLKVNLAELKAQLGCEIMGVVPPAAETCLVAQARALPLVLYQPESVVAIQLNEIASRLSADKIMVLPI
jgi:DNA-binding response OmpR family regulator